MTEQELQILQLRMKIEALYILVRGLYSGIVGTSPTGIEYLKRQFAALRQHASLVAIKGLPPEQSDLAAGEFQTALEDFLSDLEAGLVRRADAIADKGG